MFAKTFCKPGASLTVVPAGLLLTLQYNAQGLLEKAYQGFQNRDTLVTDEFLDQLKESKLLPYSIPLKGGTTWVKGVLHSDQYFEGTGELPECIYTSLKKGFTKFLKSKENKVAGYFFTAVDVESMAANFKSYVVMNNWLDMSGFHSLRACLIPVGMSESGFVDMIERSYPHIFGLFSGYFVMENGEHRYIPLNLQQCIVKTGKADVTPFGYVNYVCEDTCGITHTYAFTDAANHGIIGAKNAIVVYQNNSKIIASSGRNVTSHYTCPYCGYSQEIPIDGPFTCANMQCVSLLYPQMSKACNVLNLPNITESTFKEYIDSKKLTTILDMFLLPEYESVHIECTLAQFLQAFVPLEVCPSTTVLHRIASTCKNSIQTFEYILQNPDKLYLEMSYDETFSDREFIRRIIEWMKVPYVKLTLSTLLVSTPQIVVTPTVNRFDGPPIFRGRKIAITGNFKVGSLEDVISILSSYAAEVSVGIEENSDCLVIGDTLECIDGGSVKYATSHGITQFRESEFFEQFGIYNDIQANLL